MYPLVMNYFQKCFIAEILGNQPFISWTDWKDVTIFLYYFKRKHVKVWHYASRQFLFNKGWAILRRSSEVVVSLLHILSKLWLPFPANTQINYLVHKFCFTSIMRMMAEVAVTHSIAMVTSLTQIYILLPWLHYRLTYNTQQLFCIFFFPLLMRDLIFFHKLYLFDTLIFCWWFNTMCNIFLLFMIKQKDSI